MRAIRCGVALIATRPPFEGLAVHPMTSAAPSRGSAAELERAHLVPGDAERIIAHAIRGLDIDRRATAAYEHAAPRNAPSAGKTSALLRAATSSRRLVR